jgi:uncharacterized cupredoxin-like copper-binding protein
LVDQGLSDRAKLMLVWPVAGFFAAMAFGVGLISMAVFDSGGGTPDGSAGTTSQAIEVELGDLFIKPDQLEAQSGTATFEVANTGATEHNFAIEDVSATEMIQPGESASLRVANLKAGTYRFICEVTGHADGVWPAHCR